MHLATRLRPSCSLVPPLQAEGAGNAACWQQPMARLQKKAAAVTTGSAENNRHSPRDGLPVSSALSPGNRLSCPPSLGCSSKHIELGISTGMPEPDGFAVRERVVRRQAISSLAHASSPSHLRPNTRDDREAPLLEGRDAEKCAAHLPDEAGQEFDQASKPEKFIRQCGRRHPSNFIVATKKRDAQNGVLQVNGGREFLPSLDVASAN